MNYKFHEIVKDEEIYQYGDSVIKNNKTAKYSISSKPIFTIANKTLKGSDWLKFAKEYAEHNAVAAAETSKEIFSKYISATAFDHYRKNLEKYNSDFKYQMQEFKEGNMLFEIMERNVWSKAANDNAGLKKYYNQN